MQDDRAAHGCGSAPASHRLPPPRERCRLCAAGYQALISRLRGQSASIVADHRGPGEVPMALMPTLFVDDVEASSRWYQALLGAQSGHGGPEFEMLTLDGALILQLHHASADEHGDDRLPAGAPRVPACCCTARSPTFVRRIGPRRRWARSSRMIPSSSRPRDTPSSWCTIRTGMPSHSSNAVTPESFGPVVCMLAGGTGRAGPGSPVRILAQATRETELRSGIGGSRCKSGADPQL